MPLSSSFGDAGGRAELAERHAELGVELAQPLQRAVDVDRIVMAAAAQLHDQPLRLAERIGADQDAALGIVVQPLEQPVDLAGGAGWRKTGRPKVASVMKMSQGTGSNGAQVGSGRRL